MAISWVQGVINHTVSGVSSGSISVAMASVGLGHLVSGLLTYSSGTFALSSVKTNAGDTATLVNLFSTSEGTTYTNFYFTNLTTSPTVITADFSPQVKTIYLAADEFSGASLVSPLDTFSATVQFYSSNSFTATTSAVATAVSNELVYGTVSCLTGEDVVFHPGVGFTLRVALSGFGVSDSLITESLIEALPSNVAVTAAVVSGAQVFSALAISVMTFKPSVGGLPPIFQSMVI